MTEISAEARAAVVSIAERCELFVKDAPARRTWRRIAARIIQNAIDREIARRRSERR